MTTEHGTDPDDKKYLVLPLDQLAIVNLNELVKELAGLREHVAMLTASVLKITMEMTRSNDLEGDKIRFSKMKDLLVAKLSRMIDKDRKREVTDGAAPAKQS
jgi:hypothetical protein